jgi:hypothetical protein
MDDAPTEPPSDRPPSETPPQHSPATWSTPAALVGTAWVLAVSAAAYTVLGTDPGGRILTAIAAAGLALFALFGTVARPRLSVDAGGVEIRRLSGRQRLPWKAVQLSVSTTRRLGRRMSLLELDVAGQDEGGEGDGGLIVLGWLDLGTEPEEVAAAIRSYWR